MEIILKKQPRKFLSSVDTNTRKKLTLALDGLRELRGNIVALAGKKKPLYRLKIEHYRIIFTYDGGKLIIVETINTRTNIKYRRY